MTAGAKRKGAPSKSAVTAFKPGVVPAHKKHFSVAETAAILDTSTRSVYRNVRLGVIDKLRRRGLIRIPREELERILNHNGYGEEV